MSSRNVLVAALALGLAAAPAAAQTREVQNEVNAKLATERARLAEEQVRADRDQATRERYEEIEIMSRLLDRSLDKLAGVGFHGDVRAVAFSPRSSLRTRSHSVIGFGAGLSGPATGFWKWSGTVAVKTMPCPLR